MRPAYLGPNVLFVSVYDLALRDETVEHASIGMPHRKHHGEIGRTHDLDEMQPSRRSTRFRAWGVLAVSPRARASAGRLDQSNAEVGLSARASRSARSA